MDELTLEAQGLLLRMWCVCNQRGNIPDDAEEIARLTRCRVQSVSQCYPQCKRFFKLRDGLLYSKRMETEKAKSEIASANAQRRYSKDTYPVENPNSNASGIASRIAKKVRGQERKRAEGEREENARGAAPLALHELASAKPRPPALNQHSGSNTSSDANIPDGLTDLQYAIHALNAADVRANDSLRDQTAQAIGFVVKIEGCDAPGATRRIRDRMRAAQARGKTVNEFWFEDGHWQG